MATGRAPRVVLSEAVMTQNQQKLISNWVRTVGNRCVPQFSSLFNAPRLLCMSLGESLIILDQMRSLWGCGASYPPPRLQLSFTRSDCVALGKSLTLLVT